LAGSDVPMLLPYQVDRLCDHRLLRLRFYRMHCPVRLSAEGERKLGCGKLSRPETLVIDQSTFDPNRLVLARLTTGRRRMRLSLILGCAALVAAGVVDAPADARGRSPYAKKSKRTRVRGFSSAGSRGESSTGQCPCNGGDVCVGPRGGRYCITSGGNKRYGV
jgi:hypothetical protein